MSTHDKPKGEAITADEQLERWVAGDPVHSSLTGECCPDFSCCNPELLSTPEFRQAFADAHRRGDEQARLAMLGSCLTAGLAALAPDKKIHVTGTGDKEKA